MRVKSDRLQPVFHKAFCVVLTANSSTSLKDELRIGSGFGLSGSLTYIIPLVVVIILTSAAIALLIARRSRKRG